jgi:hypothetical protein
MSDSKITTVPDSFNDRIKGGTLLEKPLETYKQYWQATSLIVNELLDEDKAIQLIKYLFGVPFDSCGDLKWIQQAYFQSDPFFTMNEENNRELLRHLCAAVISYTIEGDHMLSEGVAQSVLTSSLVGLKQPFGNSSILELADGVLVKNSVEARVRPDFNDISVTAVFNEDDMKDVQRAEDEAGEGEDGDEQWKTQLLTRLVENSSEIKGETEELHEVVKKHLKLIDEEVNVLWWVLNGFSEKFNKDFAELNKFELIFSCGIQLSEMSPSSIEPPSFKNLLRKASICDEKFKLTDFFSEFSESDVLKGIEDIDSVLQPVLYGLISYTNNGKDEWAQSTGVDENTLISELDLTTQLFREFSSIK